MFKKPILILMVITCFSQAQITFNEQEFPIAVGTDTTFCSGGAFDGTNFLISILGDSQNQNSITAQLVAPSGSLIGSRISVGRLGVFPGAAVAFDGSNYLLVWLESNGTLSGQFINPAGNLVGTPFVISANALAESQFTIQLAFGGSTYMVIYVQNNGYPYGQRIDKSGNLTGGPIQLSSNYARDLSIACDGANYLVTWVKKIPQTDKDIYGQFVSTSGALVGNNFLIDGGPNYSDNPTSLAFDGTRYLLTFHEQIPGTQAWDLFASFITTAGEIEATIMICDSTEDPFLPKVAFGNGEYLITWSQYSNYSLMGNFYTPAGVALDTPVVLMTATDSKMPLGACVFGGNQFFVTATKMDSNFTDGDVYGAFTIPLTGIEKSVTPEKFVLCQNYPNPFNPSTTIEFSLPESDFVTLTIYNVLGQVVAIPVSERRRSGIHQYHWDASGLSGGLYFYKLNTSRYQKIGKALFIK